MNKFKLVINPFAEVDIKDSIEWYNFQKENLGEEFTQKIKETVFRINDNPFQFPKVKKKIRKAIVNRFPYSIFFYIDDSVINVFAVFHISRNPIIWQKRFDKNNE